MINPHNSYNRQAYRAPAPRFGHQPQHVHSPQCNHSHHDEETPEPKTTTKSEPTNLISRFFHSIYDWFKEAFTGIWVDLFGKKPDKNEKQEHQHH